MDRLYLDDVGYLSCSFTRWWFQIFFIFTPTWGNDPIRLIFFKWVETTNQIYIFLAPGKMSNLTMGYPPLDAAAGIAGAAPRG